MGQASPQFILVATGCDLAPLGQALEALGAEISQVPHADDGAALAAAIAERPGVCVIHAHMPEPIVPALFQDIDEAAWAQGCEEPLRRTVATMLAARKALLAAGAGGAIVGLGPAVSLVGGLRLSPLATAVEGQRTLTKSAARQSLTTGLAINWVAVHPALLTPELADLPRLTRFDPSGYPVTRIGYDRLAPLLLALAGPAGHAISGQTLVADGGDWMLP